MQNNNGAVAIVSEEVLQARQWAKRREEIREIALKTFERGEITFWEYDLICAKNELLAF